MLMLSPLLGDSLGLQFPAVKTPGLPPTPTKTAYHPAPARSSLKQANRPQPN